jgi:hypothetical protein
VCGLLGDSLPWFRYFDEHVEGDHSDSLWQCVSALRMSVSYTIAALVRLEIVMASCLVKRKQNDISWWFGHMIEQISRHGKERLQLG